MKETRFGYQIEVDIHGMRCEEAKRQLELLLKRTGRDIHEIVVVHGYHNGSALLNMVRNEFKHPRIKQKVVGLNNGQTTFVLKELTADGKIK